MHDLIQTFLPPIVGNPDFASCTIFWCFFFPLPETFAHVNATTTSSASGSRLAAELAQSQLGAVIADLEISSSSSGESPTDFKLGLKNAPPHATVGVPSSITAERGLVIGTTPATSTTTAASSKTSAAAPPLTTPAPSTAAAKPGPKLQGKQQNHGQEKMVPRQYPNKENGNQREKKKGSRS
ncbi:hypothetical protein Pelo_6900 [Pelomyxa schiedti]|nr:hypothetical protein Pelo_6900 [Pelomyxa schiedti]